MQYTIFKEWQSCTPFLSGVYSLLKNRCNYIWKREKRRKGKKFRCVCRHHHTLPSRWNGNNPPSPPSVSGRNSLPRIHILQIEFGHIYPYILTLHTLPSNRRLRNANYIVVHIQMCFSCTYVDVQLHLSMMARRYNHAGPTAPTNQQEIIFLPDRRFRNFWAS